MTLKNSGWEKKKNEMAVGGNSGAELRDGERNFAQPLWLGSDEIMKGKTILLHAEQGLGDMLQFCRATCHLSWSAPRTS